MTGPVREDLPETEPGPETPPVKPDPWDEPDEDVPVDLEDIALVAWEAVRAYRTTQGSGSGHPWMHRTVRERTEMLKTVKAAQSDPDAHICENPEHRLIAAIVRALTP